MCLQIVVRGPTAVISDTRELRFRKSFKLPHHGHDNFPRAVSRP
jgi:hypothetical protein